MAHITHFRVEGLAGQPGSVERQLDRHVNVFFGLNGSGKTSLLRILDSGMSGDASTLLTVPFRIAEVTVFSDHYQKEFTRRIDKVKLLASPKPEQGARLYLDEQGRFVPQQRPSGGWDIEPELPSESRGNWSHVYLPISRMYARATRSSGYHILSPEEAVLSPEEQLNTDFARELVGVWREYFADVLESVRQAQAEGLANILQAVLSPKDGAGDVAVDPETAYRRAYVLSCVGKDLPS